MSYTKVHLEIGSRGKDCRLYVDDVLVEGVCRVEIVADVDEATRVTITRLLVEGEAGGLVDTTAIGEEHRQAKRLRRDDGA